MKKRIVLNNYSSGSFGNIFKDSQLNVYKITIISESGLLTVTNINEIIFFNNFIKITQNIINKKKNKNSDDMCDLSDDSTINNSNNDITNLSGDNTHNNDIKLSNLITCDIPSYESALNDKIFMQSLSTNYYNETTLFNTFNFNDKNMQYFYNSLLFGRTDKIILISKLPNYTNNLSKFINIYHTYAISNFDAIAKKLLKSLAILHHNGFLHGDLKTTNILINDANNICLTDFGGIKIINFDSYHLSCTLTSRCPEDLKYNYDNKIFINTNYKSDIWSLGLIFAEIILGFNPMLKLYNKIKKFNMKNETVEKNMLLYYDSIKYIDINELANADVHIKSYLNENLQNKIQIIENMLIIDHTKRISTIEEVYEKMFGEKFEYNFMISYEYNYLKYNTEHNFDTIFLIRKKYYKELYDVCSNLHFLFICPLIIDIFDRILIKLVKKIENITKELKDIELKILSCAVIILASGIFNQNHPTYQKILNLFNLKHDVINITYLNNKLLKVLELLNYDIFRPFNIFYCSYYLNNKICLCDNKENFKKTGKIISCIIHNHKENDFFKIILNKKIDDNIIGITPEDYYEHMKIYKNV